jgi:hypothetical protein
MTNKCEKCGFNHNIESESCDQVKARVELLMKGIEVIKSGYGGILRNGNIVDRRDHPEAIPLQENKMLGTPKPKKL